MQRFRWPWLGVVVWGGLALSCGNALYVVQVAQASDAVARAEQVDAAKKAPYEYYFAVEHLRKARSEAAEADYGDASKLAVTAYEYATRAAQVAQRVAPASALPSGETQPGRVSPASVGGTQP